MQHSKPRDFAALAHAKQNHPPQTPPPVLLVLVGIPGSGKSTFAKLLTDTGWARVSQDDLGTRPLCQAHTVDYLLQGRNVVIDRCNFDPSQRKHWIDYANARGCTLGVIVFATPLQVCLNRVNNRRDHPTLVPGPQASSVVHSMANAFVAPTQSEGFHFCRIIRNPADVDKVLTELLSKPPGTSQRYN